MNSVEGIIPVILAAGNSTRMGYPKALLPFRDGTFLTHILAVLKRAGLPKPIIVLGKAACAIRPVIMEWDSVVLVNENPGRGQLSSIQIALSSLPSECDAVMIWPVDQPAISEALVKKLVRLFITSKKLIALPINGERRGHPAIFDRILFREFMDAPLMEGPKSILVRHRNETAELPAAEAGCVKDIDTPSDYVELTGKSPEAALRNAGFPAPASVSRSGERR